MKMLLLFVLGVVAIGVLVIAQPNARNLLAVKVGGVVCVVATAVALIWPEHVLAVVGSTLAFLILWIFWRGVTWPIRYVASVFRRSS